MFTFIYCYDVYCGWCYGFSLVIQKITSEYKNIIAVEVLSGGMVITDTPRHINITASYIQSTYKTVEEYTGVSFGKDYLWHIFNPDKSDWFPSSEKPSIALCILKEYFPDDQVKIASDLQYALHYEGRDLCDDEAYRHLLHQYNINAEEFYNKLHSEEYKEKAYYEFALVKQLQVTGFPTLLLQVSNTKLYLLSSGYTDYETLRKRINSILEEIKLVEGR